MDTSELLKRVGRSKGIEAQTHRVVATVLWALGLKHDTHEWAYPEPHKLVTEGEYDPTAGDLVAYLRQPHCSLARIYELVTLAPTNETATIAVETEILVGCGVAEMQTEGRVNAKDVHRQACRAETAELQVTLSLLGRSAAAYPAPLSFIHAQMYARNAEFRQVIEYSLIDSLDAMFTASTQKG